MTLEKIGYKTVDNILVNYSKNKKVYYFKYEKDGTKTTLIIDWQNKMVRKFNKMSCKYEKFGIDEIYAIGGILRATRTIFEEIRGIK